MVSQAVKYPLFWTPSPREGAKKQLFSGQDSSWMKIAFFCVKSVSEHIICHYLGSNTQPKMKSPKAVSWGGGLNSYGQPDRKITVFTPSLRFLPAN